MPALARSLALLLVRCGFWGGSCCPLRQKRFQEACPTFNEVRFAEARGGHDFAEAYTAVGLQRQKVAIGLQRQEVAMGPEAVAIRKM